MSTATSNPARRLARAFSLFLTLLACWAAGCERATESGDFEELARATHEFYFAIQTDDADAAAALVDAETKAWFERLRADEAQGAELTPAQRAVLDRLAARCGDTKLADLSVGQMLVGGLQAPGDPSPLENLEFEFQGDRAVARIPQGPVVAGFTREDSAWKLNLVPTLTLVDGVLEQLRREEAAADPSGG